VMAGARREGRDEAGRLDRRVRASIFSVGYVSAFEWFKETRVREVLAMRIAMSDDVVRWLLLETGCLLFACLYILVSMSYVSVVTVEDLATSC
jgi:hypothetical protein